MEDYENVLCYNEDLYEGNVDEIEFRAFLDECMNYYCVKRVNKDQFDVCIRDHVVYKVVNCQNISTAYLQCMFKELKEWILDEGIYGDIYQVDAWDFLRDAIEDGGRAWDFTREVKEYVGHDDLKYDEKTGLVVLDN